METSAPPQRPGSGDVALRDLGHPGHGPHPPQGAGRPDVETPETAETRGRVDIALALTLRDGGLRVSEAAALAWRERGALAQRVGEAHHPPVKRPTGPESREAVVAITPACLQALDAIRMERAEDRDRVFRLTPRQMTNRIKAACHAAGLEGDVFSGHSGRVGLARMMSGAGAPTETTMRQGRWKSAESWSRRYTRGETAGAALRWMDGGTEPGP